MEAVRNRRNSRSAAVRESMPVEARRTVLLHTGRAMSVGWSAWVLQPFAPPLHCVTEPFSLLCAELLFLLLRTSAIRAVQVYRRLRGTLFFGPGFAVTKNKLTFCDALDQILAEAKPGAAALVQHVLCIAWIRLISFCRRRLC